MGGERGPKIYIYLLALTLYELEDILPYKLLWNILNTISIYMQIQAHTFTHKPISTKQRIFLCNEFSL